MHTDNYSPSLTSIQLSTKQGQNTFFLNSDTENSLHISCTVDGLNQLMFNASDRMRNYIAVYFTLYHHFGYKNTTSVRMYKVEFNLKKGWDDSGFAHIELSIPIDDDFSDIDFINNYYYLQISFTHKHPDEMGISESIRTNPIFNVKIPFVIKEVL